MQRASCCFQILQHMCHWAIATETILMAQCQQAAFCQLIDYSAALLKVADLRQLNSIQLWSNAARR